MRSAPQSWLLAAISLINLMVSCESLGFLERAFDLCFQYTRKSSRCQREIRFRLDKKERLFPGPNHSSTTVVSMIEWEEKREQQRP